MGACMAAMVVAAVTVTIREVLLMPGARVCHGEHIRCRVITRRGPRRIARQREQKKTEGQEAF